MKWIMSRQWKAVIAVRGGFISGHARARIMFRHQVLACPANKH